MRGLQGGELIAPLQKALKGRKAMRKLPDDIKREVNRLAHAFAQWSFMEQRRRLESEALALLRAGRTRDEVLAQLAAQAAPARR